MATTVNDIIEIREYRRGDLHIIEIMEANPQPPPVPNERLMGFGAQLSRAYGGEWVFDFESGYMQKIACC
jgi:hypothetical protein